MLLEFEEQDSKRKESYTDKNHLQICVEVALPLGQILMVGLQDKTLKITGSRQGGVSYRTTPEGTRGQEPLEFWLGKEQSMLNNPSIGLKPSGRACL